MNRKKQLVVKTMILLFTVSVSVAAVPGTGIHSYGLFGEIKTISINDNNKEVVISAIPHSIKSANKVISLNVFNIWFEIVIAIILLKYTMFWVKLPCFKTIVSMKVRMND